MAKRAAILSLVALAFAGGYLYSHYSNGKNNTAADTQSSRKILYYYDPMHPSYRSDEPGIAPDCEMDLVPKYADEETAYNRERRILYYHDPMHPSYRSDKPGIAPDCKMALVPVYAEDDAAMGGSDSSTPMETVHISPEKQQLIGVEYGTVEYGPAFQTIRAPARVSFDESKVYHVQSKYDGWIDQVFVTLVGTEVRKNQPLLTVYNPQSIPAQMEFIKHSNKGWEMGMPAAINAPGDVLKNQPSIPPPPRSGGSAPSNSPEELGVTSEKNALNYEALIAADRYRLQQLGFDDEVLAVIAKSRTPMWKLIVRSPIDGVVTERNSFEKQRVTPETMYTIVDMSTVWVTADLLEYDAEAIKVGQSATLRLPFMSGRTFKGKVDAVLPSLDPTSRTLKVRLLFDNPDRLLRAEMYGDVELHSGGSKRLVAPQSAVLNSGLKQLVFVDRGNGYFETRSVTTGNLIGDRIEILSGLRAGERIVTSGNFLIDSESQLKASRAGHDRSNH